MSVFGTAGIDRSLRVLIVEDSVDDAESVVETLRRDGYDLTWKRVQSPQTTGAALDGETWDIVIADYNLPYFSGLEALTMVQERDVDLPVIIVSGALDEDAAVAALHLGATDYVMKRNLERLVPAVERALREAGERRSRRRAEEALRESEERYRQLVENANDVVLTVDLAGNFTSLNRAGEQISGYTRDELSTMNMADVLTPESFTAAMEMMRRKLTEDRPTTYELEMIARDGHHVPLEVSSRLIYAGGAPVGVQAIARDITERHRAEEELRARERKQAAVAELGQRALASTDLDTLFLEAAGVVAQTLGAEYCSVLELLPGGDRLLGRAGVGWKSGLMGRATVEAGPGSQAGYTLLSSEPVVVEDLGVETRFSIPEILTEHGLTSGVSVIIHGQRRPFGTLNVFSAERRSFTQDDVLFLQAVANVLGTAIERKRLEDEHAQHSKELAARVLQAQEEERKRIARELHDETAQTLSVLLANLDLLEGALPPQCGQRPPSGDDQLRAGFEKVGALARRALDETRALSHDLRPTILDDVGLVAALEWLAEEYQQASGGSVRFHADPEPDGVLSTEIEVAVFRIAQEALTNCGKHAAANEVSVALTFPDGVGAEVGERVARLVVEDDGRGFDAERVPRPTRQGRLGLYGMYERAALFGGRLEIVTAPGKGTRICLEIPLTQTGDRAVVRDDAGLVEGPAEGRRATAGTEVA